MKKSAQIPKYRGGLNKPAWLTILKKYFDIWKSLAIAIGKK
jgi:hypothetical protein